MQRILVKEDVAHLSLGDMSSMSSSYCLGCGKELIRKPAFQGSPYRVCGECAEIMQQDFHNDFFKVTKTVSRNLDQVRAGKN